MPEINEKNLEQEIRQLVSEIAEIDSEKIKLETKFIEDLGMDSMMALEILGSLEKKYKTRIPEQNMSEMVNLKSIIELMKNLMS